MSYQQILSATRGQSDADFEAAITQAQIARRAAAEAVAYERAMARACGDAYIRRVTSTDGSENPLAYIVREFFCANRRFPTTSEILRRM